MLVALSMQSASCGGKLHKTTVTITGDLTGFCGHFATLSAALEDDGGNAIQGEEISFSIGSLNPSALTDANGIASTTVALALEAGDYTVQAEFAGDNRYLPSSDSDAFAIEQLRMYGLCYSPFRDGQDPDLGLFSTVEEIEEDMEFLKAITDRVRTYGSTNNLANIPRLAKEAGLSVYQGVFLGKDLEVNDAEINSVIDIARQGLVESIIVGNETILLGVLTKDELIQYIRWVKTSILQDIPVTTAEAWSVWIDHPELVNEVDYILVHIHPFWEDKPIDGAAMYVLEKYNEVQEAYPDKRIVIGETGWPSAGDPAWAGVSETVIPSEANQCRFLREFTRLASENSIEYSFLKPSMRSGSGMKVAAAEALTN